MDLSLATLVFTLRLTGDISDPYAFFRMKRPLEEACLTLFGCGDHGGDCCNLPLDCACSLVFSRPLATDPTAVRRHQKPSPPFVFHVPFVPRAPNKGAVLELGVTLVGSAINCSFEFLSAVQSVFSKGKKAPFPVEIVQIETEGYGGERAAVRISEGHAVDGLVMISADGLMRARSLDPNSLPLNMETPLRLIEQGRPVRRFRASLFLRSLMRRVSALAYYYGGFELDLDFKWLARLADEIMLKEEKLTWSDPAAALSGLRGTATLEGDLTEFHQFLLLGEYVHVGKGASYGFGRFRLSPDPP